jgi:formylglycine-generating enzyme required for sulfatase activity
MIPQGPIPMIRRLFILVAALSSILGVARLLSAQDRRLRPEQATVQPAGQEARVALVIGNSAYEGAVLKNPVNDARGVAEALRACKFEVTTLTDATKRQMDDAIAAFGERIRGGAVGLFYFAGHGVQVSGKNYLIPIGAKLAQEVDAKYQGVDVGEVLDRMDTAKNGLNILILDACRNNPFARSWHRGLGGEGLAQVKAPTGSLISYATAPGSTAADGEGEHGIYTEALLKEMQKPGESLLEVFQKVRERVLQQSRREQVPWESNSTVGDFYFVPLVKHPTGPTEAQLEATVWEGIQDSRKAHDFESFLTKFPNGNFAELAKAKLANLKRASENIVVSNLAEPWKALQRDKLETQAEYAARVASLGAVKVGMAAISVDNYDADRRLLVLPIRVDAWAEPYVKRSKVVVEVDRAQMRALVSVGALVTVAARFTVKDGQARAGALVLSTSLGVLLPPPPTRNAQGRPEIQVEAEGVLLTLVEIPAGSFQMGTAGDTGDERQHEVTISHAFWLGKFPVTQGQWQAVMRSNPSCFKGAGLDAPVESVSWEDARNFLSKLNEMQSQFTFRLPTEAEWEYACRAGTTGETYGPMDAIAWYHDNSGETTHPVGQKQPNAFGLYDMLGNVWQWCQDWHREIYYLFSPPVDPPGPSIGPSRVFRGSAWDVKAKHVRSAIRNYAPPDVCAAGLGFRAVAVARTQ